MQEWQRQQLCVHADMMDKKRGRTISRVVFWIALVGALVCLAVTVGYYWSRYWSARNYEKLREDVAQIQSELVTEVQSEAMNSTPTLEEIEAAEFTGIIDAPEPKIPQEVLTDAEDHPVDFAKLKEINPEIYAWIRIPDTNIDYPVAQHAGEDQTYYLKHDLYGTPQFAGCIFSQEPSAKDLSDPVTVLYGHNMKNGSMFQNLYHFVEEGALEQDPYVYMYTDGHTCVYRIYAAYYYDDRNITQVYDFTDREDLEKYIEETKKPRSMAEQTAKTDEVDISDRILTLSTCVAGQPSERLLVQAVLEHES